MELSKIEKNGIICAVVNSEDLVITDTQSALDVLMSAKYDVGTEKNPALHTAPKTNVNQANCALYFNDLGFSKTKLMIFSTFSKWSDGGLITNAYRFR